MHKKHPLLALSVAVASFLVSPETAHAQRADENVVISAEDAFGTSVGREAIGIYGPGSVRGFSPQVAGNVRIEGLYFDQRGGLTGRIQSGSIVRVGASAQADIFPAPTGIVDLGLRQSGQNSMLSILPSWGPFGGYALELDGQLRMTDTVSTAVGVSGGLSRFGNGGQAESLGFGMVPRWQPSPNLSFTGFWGRSNTYGETTAPIYIPQSDRILGEIKRGIYQGPDWAKSDRFTENFGLVADSSIGSWSIKAGVFRSIFQSEQSYTNLISNITSDGPVDRLMFANPPSRSASFSGEVRASRSFTTGNKDHLFVVSLRARDVQSRYGGSDFVDLGSAMLGQSITPLQPQFTFGDQNTDNVQQQTIGLSYGLKWDDLFDVRAGMQRTRYQKEALAPSAVSTDSTTLAWLPNLTLGVHVTPRATLYGSYIRGLEENGVAPDFAVNRLETLPALITRQVDFGVQWKPTDATRIVIGYYDIKKPYFTLDFDGVYRSLGAQIHRGLEFSVSTSVVEGLRILAGGVIGDPVVDIDPLASEGVGQRPVGQASNIATLSMNYHVKSLSGVSLDSSVVYRSKQASNLENSYFIPSLTTLNLGMRYAFNLRRAPATLRVSVNNVTNKFQWFIIGSGAFEPLEQRSVTAYLTVDI